LTDDGFAAENDGLPKARYQRKKTLKNMFTTGMIWAGKDVISIKIQGKTIRADLNEGGHISFQVRNEWQPVHYIGYCLTASLYLIHV
jgi:hypothetical protein